MFTNPIDARDEMFQHFADRWEAATAAILAEPVETRWQGKKEEAIPNDYYVRLSTKTEGSPSGGFLQNGDGPSPQVFDSFGNLFVQVFAPIGAEDSYRKGELLAIASRDIFRANETNSGVWFRNVRYTELENDGKFYRWKVTVEFEFSER